MKVRMCVSIAGHAEPLYELPEFSFAPGDEVDLHADLAKAWISCGHAEKISRRKATAAVAEEPEQSTIPVVSDPESN
jgi:hypothetical protein